MLGPPELRATSGLLLPGGALGDVKLRTNLDKGGQSRRECSSLELLRRGVSRHRFPYVTHRAAAATESVLFKSGLKCAFCHILAQEPIFQSPVCMGRPAAAAPC